MEGQTTEEFSSSLDSIFGVTSDNTINVTEKQASLPQMSVNKMEN